MDAMPQDETDYTRVRFHVQRGSGTDNRGDVTVEVSKSTDEADAQGVTEEAKTRFDEAKNYLETELGLDG